jgi:hypothetical protein
MHRRLRHAQTAASCASCVMYRSSGPQTRRCQARRASFWSVVMSICGDDLDLGSCGGVVDACAALAYRTQGVNPIVIQIESGSIWMVIPQRQSAHPPSAGQVAQCRMGWACCGLCCINRTGTRDQSASALLSAQWRMSGKCRSYATCTL